MVNSHNQKCSECGSEMHISSGPGRTSFYRGQPGYIIPEHLSFLVCDHCGAEWMDGDQINELSDAFEAQRAERDLNNQVNNGALLEIEDTLAFSPFD